VIPSVLTVQTPAKINPVLEVLGRRPDGYHELALVFQAVGLYDELSFSEISEGVRLVLHPSPVHLEVDDSNLIVKAAKLFLKDVLKGQGGVRIELKKRIPLAAGLGGGSSDAAATLQGLDWLFETQVKEEQLQAMAGQLGSDVPFFLTGGTALGTGRGDKITPWRDGFEMPMVLVKPPEGLSTPDVYRSGKALLTPGEKARGFQEILREKNLQKIAGSMFNGLEPAALFLMPEIGEIKKQLLDAGALGALVSGSGPTVFAIAESQEKAEQMAWKLEGEGWTVFVTRTIATGIEKI
jgi:4-diphosphocytidyl-2-C-methyl-D-erythritol kinase